MARLIGVDLPRDKRVEIGLTYIYGVAVSYTHLDVYKRQGGPVLTAVARAFRTPDLRKKLLFTLLIICLLYTSRCV